MSTRGRISAAVALGLLLAALGGTAAVAAPLVTTDYPSVSTVAGEQLDVPLEISGSPGERVSLDVEGLPDGWSATLTGGGYTIGAVTVPPGGQEPASATLELQVPADAAEGTHQLQIEASSSAGADELPVEVTISQTASSAVSLETEFTTLTGAPDDTFTWTATLHNDVPEEVTYQLDAQGPDGWDVAATPTSESRANTVTVGGGETAEIDVEATPPSGVSAGTYPITLEAVGGDRSAQIELTADVTGEPQLSLSTASERLNASGSAGEATPVQLVVTNEGAAPAQSVQLSASPPSDWSVEFEPSAIDQIPAGESAQVTARIIPADDAIVGDYVTTLTAEADGQQASTDVRFTVETSGLWGLVSVVVIILVVGGLVEVFRRYGRR